MTLSELIQAARQALAVGKVGTPVSLKIWAQFVGTAAEVPDRIADLLARFAPLLDDPPESLLATGADGDRHGQALLSTVRGRSAVVAVNAAGTEASVRFLLVGNHGVLQLTGNSDLEDESPGEAAAASVWKAALEAARQTRRRTPVGL